MEIRRRTVIGRGEIYRRKKSYREGERRDERGE